MKWTFSEHANSECAAGKKGAAAVSTTSSGWVPVQGSKYTADLDCCVHSPDLRGPLLNSPHWNDSQEHSKRATQSKSHCKFCGMYQGRDQIKESNLERKSMRRHDGDLTLQHLPVSDMRIPSLSWYFFRPHPLISLGCYFLTISSYRTNRAREKGEHFFLTKLKPVLSKTDEYACASLNMWFVSYLPTCI